MNLFGVTDLVAGDEIEPMVDAEHAEKGMRKTVWCEILGFCFVQKRESSVAHRAEIAKLGVFFAEEGGVDRNRRAEAANAIFDQEERKTKTLRQRDRCWLVAQDAFCVGDDAGFDLAKMGGDFGSGPGGVGGPGLPVFQRDGVGGGEVDGLCAEEVGADGVEIWHVLCNGHAGREADVEVLRAACAALQDDKF